MQIGKMYKLSNPDKLNKDPLGHALFFILQRNPVFTVINKCKFSVNSVKFVDGKYSNDIEIYNPVTYAISNFYIPARLYDCFDYAYPEDEVDHREVKIKREIASSLTV